MVDQEGGGESSGNPLWNTLWRLLCLGTSLHSCCSSLSLNLVPFAAMSACVTAT